MIKHALLFVDFERSTPAERNVWAQTLTDGLYVSNQIVDFFTSDLDKLAIISKHRVVSLPTLIVLDERNKVFARILSMPTVDELRNLTTAQND